MSGSLQSPCDNLPSGNYHGRVIEQSEKSNQIIVLIKDRLFRLIMEETVKLPMGSLISFKVNLDKKLEKIKIKNSTSNFEANGDIFRWIKLTKKPSRMEFLQTRHQIIRGIRKWFDQQNFIETETPLLVSAPSPEAQLFPVKTEKGYLITSPEYQMKRLLVGGFDKIFQITRCFRDAENSPQHNPEFTMLEWYRTYQPLEKLMTDIEQFVLHLSDSVKSNLLSKKIPCHHGHVNLLVLYLKNILELNSMVLKQLMNCEKRQNYLDMKSYFMTCLILQNSQIHWHMNKLFSGYGTIYKTGFHNLLLFLYLTGLCHLQVLPEKTQ